ncbi:MAG: NAD-dependent epimerase/dehydratase family protein [Vulcanimicrobiota bacterium]
MQNLIITGVTGFLGSELASFFLGKGHEVTGIGRKEKGLLPESVIKNKKFTFIRGDIGSDPDFLLQIPYADGIFHIAAQQPSSPGLTYEDYYLGNVMTTINITRFAARKKVKLFAYTSTTSVSGIIVFNKPIDENTQVNPSNYYGLTKYIGECVPKIELSQTGTKVVIVRMPSLFGKNHCGGLIYTYYKSITCEKELEIYGKGQNRRNVLNINDAVNFLYCIVEQFNFLEQFNLFVAGASNSLSMLDIASKIKKIVKSNVAILPVDRENGLLGDILIDVNKARRILKYKPNNIESSLEKYVSEMEKHEI